MEGLFFPQRSRASERACVLASEIFPAAWAQGHGKAADWLLLGAAGCWGGLFCQMDRRLILLRAHRGPTASPTTRGRVAILDRTALGGW
jgi:hypothetical protein